MTVQQPQGDLARGVNHDPNDEWPTLIEIVAYWGKDGRRGRRRSIEIPAGQFFGYGGFGAPMTGDQLIGMVDRLRRQGPEQVKG